MHHFSDTAISFGGCGQSGGGRKRGQKPSIPSRRYGLFAQRCESNAITQQERSEMSEGLKTFAAQVSAGAYVSDVFYILGCFGALLGMAALTPLDAGIVDTIVQKWACSLIRGVAFLAISYGMWNWQIYQAFGLLHALAQALSDWSLLFGPDLTTYALQHAYISFVTQLQGVVLMAAGLAVVGFLVILVLEKTIGPRVTAAQEDQGLDATSGCDSP